MSTSNGSPSSLPPHAQIIQMGTAYWVSQFVCTAANMRLADHLSDGPRSAGELAAVTAPIRARCIDSCGRWRASAS